MLFRNHPILYMLLNRTLFFRIACLVLSSIFLVLSQSTLIYALPEEQRKLYISGILYYDLDACASQSSSNPALAPGQGAPDGLLFPNLDPNAMAEAINRYIESVNPNSKMKGLGSTIVASAKNANLNPFLIVAIAQKESSLSDPSDYNVRHGNNSFGRTATASQPHFVGARMWYKWSSVKASVDHTAPENINAAGGGDIASYIKIQYKEQIKNSNLIELMMAYAPPSENNTEEYIRNVRSWVDKMIELTKQSRSSRSSTTSSSNIQYVAKGNIPLEGKTVIASVYGTKGEKDRNGKYIEDLSGMEGGPLDEQGKPLQGRPVVAEMMSNTALGGLPYGSKIEITYKGRSIIAEVSDNGPGAGEHSDIDLWRETADLLGFPYTKEPVRIRGVSDDTPLTPVNSQASITGQGADQNCVCTTETTQLTGANAEEKIFNFYVNNNYTPEQAAGFVGNYYQESGYDPTRINGSSGATGIAQWLGGRLIALQNFAREKGKPYTDFQTQLEFSIHELNNDEKGANEAIKAVTESGREAVEQVTVVIRKRYERPREAEANDARRIKKALEVYEKLGDGSGGTVSGTPDSIGGCAGSQGTGVSSGSFIWPLETKYPVTSCYGYARKRLHTGIDIAAPRGTPIKAADGGTVELARDYDPGGFGKAVVINHGNGFWTLYAHLHTVSVRQGQKVDQGQVIGTVNNTGSSFGDHLHFNIQKASGEGQATVNPLEYLPKDPSRGVSGGDCPSSLG